MLLAERFAVPRETLRQLPLRCKVDGQNHTHVLLVHGPRGYPSRNGVDPTTIVPHLKQDLPHCTLLDPCNEHKVVSFANVGDIEDFALACEASMRSAMLSVVPSPRLTRLVLHDRAANPESGGGYLSDALFNARRSASPGCAIVRDANARCCQRLS